MNRFRTFLKIAALLLILLVAAAALFLTTFDLNQYRQQLARNLSQALATPVSIGAIELALLPAPSIDCQELQIGSPQDNQLLIKTDHLYLKLQLLPLLTRQLEFTEVLLRHPVINIPTADDDSPVATARFNSGLNRWLQNARIQKLRLTDAEILLPETATRPQTSLVLQLFLDNLRPGESGFISAAGILTQGNTSSPFDLEGSVQFQQQLTDWRNWELQARGKLRNLHPANWFALLNMPPPPLIIDRVDLADFSLLGQPSTGLRLKMDASGDNLALRGQKFRDIALPPLQLSALWSISGSQQQFDRVELNLGKTSLKGSLAFDSSAPDGFFDMQLALTSPLAELSRLIPAPDMSNTVDMLQKSILAGDFKLEARLKLPFSEAADANAWLQQATLSADLTRGSIHLGPFGQATDFNLALRQQKGQLQINNSHLNWLKAPFDISGGISWSTKGDGKISIVVAGQPDVAQAISLLPEALRDQFQLNGKIPIRILLDGPLDQIKLAYTCDVKFLQGQFGTAYFKPAGLEGKIFAEGTLRDRVINLQNAGVKLPPFDLTGNARFNLAKENGYTADFKLAAIDLERAQFRSPLLAKLNTRGKLTASGKIAGSKTQPIKLDGRISFQKFGLQITQVIADLQQINGNLLFNEKSLETVLLNAHLGDSPVTLQGGIADWQHPDIKIHLRGKTVRANDLIFPSDQMLLHDLDGSLSIDRNGIDFETVTVRLDGGTRATVKGRMESYHAPHVALDITSEYGNIDEVIGLWQTSQPQPRPLPKPGQGVTTTAIHIKAAAGQIGPFKFSDAEALLKTDGRGHLVILPLHFRHGAGYGVGHVAVDSTRPGASLLTVSGHVENFDASAIYRDLLHREGLVSGVTRGDFSLQGEPGKNFLATSNGGINLQIDQGTLYRLPLLSKLFSLLNVSQILTLNAPEMSVEGMPFRNISGSFAMRKGVLSTRDLLIHSNSMDMSLIIDQDLKTQTLKGVLGVKPLKTVDKIISNIPLVGWILAGDDKAILTAHFTVSGSSDNPSVTPAPAASIATPIMGIFVRTLQLPGKMVTNIADALNAEPTTDNGSATPPPEPSPAEP